MVASFVLHAESSLIYISQSSSHFAADADAAATVSAIALSRGLSCTRPGGFCGGKLIPVTAAVSESRGGDGEGLMCDDEMCSFFVSLAPASSSECSSSS